MPCPNDYLVSVHDVMPETLARVTGILRTLEQAKMGPATLLVVPGRDWQARELDLLRGFAAGGHALAGHGWRHRIKRYRNPWHRLHGLLISRDVAEHLERDTTGIRELILACHAWFERHGLPPPELYVPPAWAMGSIRRKDLSGLGFRYFEYLSGIYDTRSNALHRIPLLGFEADTRFRAVTLRLSNRVNRMLATRTGRARLAIHPGDPDLLLSADLSRCLFYQFSWDGRTSTSNDHAERGCCDRK